MFPFQQQQQPFQGQQQPPLQQQQQQPFYNPSNGIPMAGQPAFPAASNVLNGPYVVQPTNSIQTMNPQQASSIGYGQAQQHPMAPMTGVLGGQAVASQQPILSPASSMIFPQQQMQPQMQQQMGLYHQPQLSQSSSQQAIYSSSASLSFRGSHTSLYGQQQEAQYFQQQQQQQQQMIAQPSVQQQPSLPPGTTVLSNQVYYVDSRRQSSFASNNNMNGSTAFYHQQQQQALYQQQPSSYPQGQVMIQAAPLVQQQPVYTQPIAQEMVPYQPPQPVAQPQMRVATPPQPSPSTNILSQADSSLLIQEAFLVAGSVHPLTGQPSPLDLQGIWTKVPNSQQGDSMKLSLRMSNQSPNGLWTFSFGLMVDPSASLLPKASTAGGVEALAPAQTHMANVNLFCSPENQRLSAGEEITALTVTIEFAMIAPSMLSSPSQQQTVRYQYRTLIPLHIFFISHPQNPGAAHESILPISASDDGPRMTQTAFLDRYASASLPTKEFSAPGGASWKRWFNQVSQSGLLDAVVGKGGATPASHLASGGLPSSREVLKVIEYKLSTNRVYVVASREAASPGTSVPDLVFFVSFHVGDGSGASKGTLVMGEVRFLATSGPDTWERCDVVLKSQVNDRLWSGLERALNSILLS